MLTALPLLRLLFLLFAPFLSIHIGPSNLSSSIQTSSSQKHAGQIRWPHESQLLQKYLNSVFYRLLVLKLMWNVVCNPFCLHHLNASQHSTWSKLGIQLTIMYTIYYMPSAIWWIVNTFCSEKRLFSIILNMFIFRSWYTWLFACEILLFFFFVKIRIAIIFCVCLFVCLHNVCVFVRCEIIMINRYDIVYRFNKLFYFRISGFHMPGLISSGLTSNA